MLEIVVPDDFKYLYVRNDERPVVKIPDAVLRQKAAEVDRLGKNLQELISDMMRIMRDAHGIGLAAPQVGVAQRVIVIAPGDTKPMAMINPKIVKFDGKMIGEEGCLSIPGLYGDVERHAYIEVEAYDRNGRPLVYELEGMPARVVQHEIDHLDGILFTDKVIEETLHWMNPEQALAEAE